MDVDTKPLVDQVNEALQKSDSLVKISGLEAALNVLYPVEKLTRLNGDVELNLKLQLTMIQMCFDRSDFETLQATMVALSKKRSVVKQAICGMVQRGMEIADELSNMDLKLKLIDTIRVVTEGKIYVEIERARTTRKLAAIKEAEGKIKEAAEVMQELQVETFGSMEKRERLDFILEQLRLLVSIKEWSKAQIVSRKIQPKVFDMNKDFEDLKVGYLKLMIELYLQDSKSYLEASKAHLEISQSPEATSMEHLKEALLLAVLSKHSKEQVQQLHVLAGEKKFEEEAPLFKQLLTLFLTNELIRWSVIEAFFGAELKASKIFADSKRIAHLRDRIIEHNIRVTAKVYTQLSLPRLAALLELEPTLAEQMLSQSVVDGMVVAKIDRIAGFINFQPRKSPEEILNGWASKTDSLLSLMVRTNHLIAKEEMLGAMQ